MATVLNPDMLNKYEFSGNTLENISTNLYDAYMIIKQAQKQLEELNFDEKRYVGTDVRKMRRDLNSLSKECFISSCKTAEMKNTAELRRKSNDINKNISVAQENTKNVVKDSICLPKIKVAVYSVSPNRKER